MNTDNYDDWSIRSPTKIKEKDKFQETLSDCSIRLGENTDKIISVIKFYERAEYK